VSKRETDSGISNLQQNDGHNPVAEVDVDVIKRATGDLGSWLGSVAFSLSVVCAIGPSS
jgi:hypothetical protein